MTPDRVAVFFVLCAGAFVPACSDGGTGADPSDGGADAGADAGPTFDCTTAPDGPFAVHPLVGPEPGEDLAFDAAGNLVGPWYGRPNIFRGPIDGAPNIFATTPDHFNAGSRFLPNGHLVVASYGRGAIVRYDTEGVEHIALSGLSYPNGIEIGMDGLVYFTEQDANRVRRVDAMTGEDEIIVEPGTIERPNGLTFSPDYRTLYVDEYGDAQFGEPDDGRKIWKVELTDDGTFTAPELFAEAGDGHGLDGMAVDFCGNVYASEFGEEIWRIRPDGSEVTAVMNLDGARYLPNLQWGTDVGGWDSMKVYLPDPLTDEVVEADMGVPGKPRPFP